MLVSCAEAQTLGLFEFLGLFLMVLLPYKFAVLSSSESEQLPLVAAFSSAMG